MKEIIDYLKNMEIEEISISELSSHLGLEESLLQDFFIDYMNYHELGSKISVELERRLADGSLAKFPGAWLGKAHTVKAIRIFNNLFVHDDRALDLFLSKNLYGYTPIYDQIELDDVIGGMYKNGWTFKHDCEIPYFHIDASFIPELIKKLNNNFFSIEWKETHFEVTTGQNSDKSDWSSAINLSLTKAVCLAIKNYLENPLSKPRFLVMQTLLGYRNDLDSVSNTLSSESEAVEFINQTNVDEEENYIIVSMKTNVQILL